MPATEMGVPLERRLQRMLFAAVLILAILVQAGIGIAVNL
jgi:hypothetical protein